MEIERTKNSIKGIISGIINKFILLLLPFIVRTIFINTLGIRYLGLNSLFSSILNILNLAELGVGSAISFTMYSAIAEKNKEKICALENLYKKLYGIIGMAIFFIGIILMPFIKFICNGDIPENINIYIIYFMYLLNSTLTYLLFAYKNSILSSHQKTYVMNNISTFISVLLNILQIIVLVFAKNYYIYLLMILLCTIINNIITALYVDKKYPEYIPKGDISKVEKNEIYKKIKALFFYKVGSVVLSSIDSVVITYFLGLTILGKYNNYYYVITVLFGFFQVFTNSLVAGVGNSIVSEEKSKNKSDFKKMNFMQGWLVSFCSICLLCLYQNFVFLWIGKDNMFDIGVVICLSVYFYVWKILDIVNLYKDAAGLWEYDKFRPLVASLVNLILNIILVQIIGIYGIIISTIVSIVLVIFPWSSYILFNKYFNKGYMKFVENAVVNAIITVFVAIITYFCCNIFKEYTIINFIIKMCICIIIPNLLLFLVYCRSKIFKETYQWFLPKIHLNNLKNKLDKVI